MDDPVDAVLFDLDDTLVTYRQPPEAILADAYDSVGVEAMFPIEAYYERYTEFLERTASVRDLRRECFAAIAAERGMDSLVAREVADAFTDRRDDADVEFLPGATEVLDTLADEYRLGVVTNGPPEVQRPKLDAVGLDGWIETVVFAGHDTSPKPDPAPFYRALGALDTAPGDAVHVGNSLQSDVAGARAAGVRSVYVPAYPEESDARPDYRIDSLSELATPPWRPS